MTVISHHQPLPRAGPARELMRESGQFWTPDWIARAMVAYVTAGEHTSVFDPAVGGGAFFRAARQIEGSIGRELTLSGTEIDPEALRHAVNDGLSDADLSAVRISHFVLNPPPGDIPAIVANPPYIRHHRLPSEEKSRLRSFGVKLLGVPLDGRAGLHVYFLLRALELLATAGRLAFIVPADTFEGVFAGALWAWITRHFRLDAIISFHPSATPFPGVDTNALIVLIRRTAPAPTFQWVTCHDRSMDLELWLRSDLTVRPRESLAVLYRSIEEGLATGLSRRPCVAKDDGVPLSEFARVMRGVATGANDFFFLQSREAAKLGIPEEYLIPAVGRTRDIPGDMLTTDTLRGLEDKGRPTRLFAPDGRPRHAFPPAVQAYLDRGEELGLPRRALLATRQPWFKMERRVPPPILFAYLGRRHVRFIRNVAEVVPLTSFLCVYPRRSDAAFTEQLWAVLSHPATVANLAQVGKSYGGGAIKIEPRALERLPIPARVLDEVGLVHPAADSQLAFL